MSIWLEILLWRLVEVVLALKVCFLVPLKQHPLTTTSGWGVYLPYSLEGVNVINSAIAGRSARSYTDEGRFTSLIDAVDPGDFVIIEFGHNDGGSLTPTDNDRTDC